MTNQAKIDAPDSTHLGFVQGSATFAANGGVGRHGACLTGEKTIQGFGWILLTQEGPAGRPILDDILAETQERRIAMTGRTANGKA